MQKKKRKRKRGLFEYESKDGETHRIPYKWSDGREKLKMIIIIVYNDNCTNWQTGKNNFIMTMDIWMYAGM